ncbi:shisa family member 2a [Denticeps clupeoides]|uniref:Shisa N-terminal domain-containing protein n=1 Tax=Denticeps clupeoides TaxID=299321 RepID=A0AAY4EJG5_9TELE|nr:protein shisa-1-like [Denticeps clupeoides]
MSPAATCAALLLVSVLVPPSAAAAGEYCHGWVDSYSAWHPGFQCPERYDGEEARYCCGTCGLRYCCTSAEARLDQGTCDDVLDDGKDKARKVTPAVPTYLPFVIVVSAFLSFVLVGTVVSVCCCHCLKPKAGERPNGQAQIQTSLLEPGAPPSDSMTPSRNSSTSSASRSAPQARPPPASEVAVSVYGPAGSMYPGLTAQQQQFAPQAHLAGQFYQPYLNYALPPEHTMMMAPAFLDNRTAYGQHHGQPFPQAPMHTEPIYPGVAI